MRIKIVKGNDPRGLCQYLLDPAKQIEKKDSPILYSNMSGRNAEELASEFRYPRTINPRVRLGMCHYCVSMPPDENIGADKIKAVSQALLEKTGHGDCQYFIVQHHDREHRNGVQHWHIATSAIALNGQWVDDGFIRRRLRQIEPQLEREFGLRQTAVRAVRDRHNLTTGEYRLKERSGRILPKEKLWQLIQRAAEGKPTMTTFVERLQRSGASVQFFGLAQGKVRGISYGTDGVAFPGGKLGPAYNFKGVQEHLGVSYDPDRDNERLQQLMKQPLAKDPDDTLNATPESGSATVTQNETSAELLNRVDTTIAQIRQRRIKLQAQSAQPAPEDNQVMNPPAPEEQVAKVKPKPQPDIEWEL